MTMAPGKVWTRDEAPERADAAYLDFVTGVRLLNAQQIRPAMRREYEQRAETFAATHQQPPRTLDDAKAILDPAPASRWYRHLARTSQEMNWNRVVESSRRYSAELEAALAESDRQGPGKVVLDSDLEYPDYYAGTEFHIQPGSYFGFPLSGYIYYFGTQVFHRGRDSKAPVDRKTEFVNGTRVPADGRVDRILEVACSVGQSTVAWKKRFPDAEVWGTDIAAPMVRYAHKLAAEQGLDVNFAQMAAEDLKFPDNHFDVVYAYIVFHELPIEVARRVIAEAYRVLRPGGVFTILDFQSAKTWTPFDAYIRDYDMHSNGEPYSMDFCHWDVPAALEAAGFTAIEEAAVDVSRRLSGAK